MARPGRRLPDAAPRMSLHAATIAISEITGLPPGRLKSFVIVAAARALPEDGGPGKTEIQICSPATLDDQIKILELTLADVRAAADG